MASAARMRVTNGAGTTTMTQHARNVQLFSNPTQNPCTGAPGTITAVAATQVMHVTQQADGTFWFTQTAQVTVTFAPTSDASAAATSRSGSASRATTRTPSSTTPPHSTSGR